MSFEADEDHSDEDVKQEDEKEEILGDLGT